MPAHRVGCRPNKVAWPHARPSPRRRRTSDQVPRAHEIGHDRTRAIIQDLDAAMLRGSPPGSNPRRLGTLKELCEKLRHDKFSELRPGALDPPTGPPRRHRKTDLQENFKGVRMAPPAVGRPSKVSGYTTRRSTRTSPSSVARNRRSFTSTSLNEQPVALLRHDSACKRLVQRAYIAKDRSRGPGRRRSRWR